MSPRLRSFIGPSAPQQRLPLKWRPAMAPLLPVTMVLAGLLWAMPWGNAKALRPSRTQILRIDGLAGRSSGTLRQGPLQVSVTREVLKRFGSRHYQGTVVRVRLQGRPVGELRGFASEGGPSAVVQLAEMDPANPYSEVLLSSFSFGTHCCNRIQVLSSNSRGTAWREVRLEPDLDGGATPAQDPLRSGRFLIVDYDNRFLYRFDCYACSHPPRRIWQLQGDRFVDVSDRSALRPLHQQRLRAMAVWFSRKDPGSVNGFLAGYVATKARLGQLPEAWALLKRRYDRHSKDGLRDCRGARDTSGRCQGRELLYSTFPDALRAFLLETGYLQADTRM